MLKFSDRNPWVIKKSEVKYENPWIKLTQHDVVTPGGSDGIYGVVSMKNKAIGIIPIDDNGFTWLVGQYRFPLNEYSWEIPMGGGPVELDVLESAKRELKEETGITAQRWTNIMRVHTSNSVTDEEGFVFLAEELEYGHTEFEDTEDLNLIKIHLSEALEYVMQSIITDAISVAGILKVARMRGL